MIEWPFVKGKGQKFDSTGYNNLCSKTVSSLFAGAFSNSRKKRRIHPQTFAPSSRIGLAST